MQRCGPCDGAADVLTGEAVPGVGCGCYAYAEQWEAMGAAGSEHSADVIGQY